MFGYIKTRPYASKTLKTEERLCSEHIDRGKFDHSFSQNSYSPWRTISFNNSNNINASSTSPPLGQILPETKVNSSVNKLVNTVLPMANTMEYTVMSYDTLPKIALKFNITPSELSRLNKLGIRTLYPGQVLKVPVSSTDTTCLECSKVGEIPQSPPKSQSMAHHENESGSSCKEPIAKRVSFEDIDEEVLETFIKVKSKYITDGQGVVNGILLITPQSLIFYPDVSEILVVDKGAEYYQCNLPMDSISAAGMFDDIAEMAFHDSLQPGHFFLDKPLMKWIGESDDFDDDNITTESSDNTLHPSLSTEEDSFIMTDTSTSDSIITDNTRSQQPDQLPSEQETSENNQHKLSETDNQFDIIEEDTTISSSSHQKIKDNQPALEQLSYVTMDTHMLHSTPKMSSFKEVDFTDINDPGYSEGLSRDSGIDDHFSGENIPRDLSLSGTSDHSSGTRQPAFDSSEIIPRLSTCHVDQPKYLCIKIKKTSWQSVRPLICEHLHEVIQKANDERREYWFSIPSARLFDVYAFFMEKCPAIHDGDSDEEQCDIENDFVGSCGSDYSIIGIPEDEELKVIDDFFSQSPGGEHIMLKTKTGQKIKKKTKKNKKQKTEIKSPQTRKISSWSICSTDEPIVPEIDGESEILTEKNIIQLSGNLPSRTVGHIWRLIYSTSVHGISLKTMYRCMADYDTPALLVIKDEKQNVFGAFASSPLECSDHFYGTGECFLFTFLPNYRIYRWSGENTFFIKGDIDSLAFGGGQGNFGLWLDEDLYRGTSHTCNTFNNDPLTTTEDFLCSAVELWCFE